MADLTRRDFIKTVSLAALAVSMPINVFAADNCTVKTRYGTIALAGSSTVKTVK